MPELMRLPRSPSLPSATELAGASEPILAGRTGFEPVVLFADNEAATLAAPRPPRVVTALGWSARGDSNPDLHGLNVPRLPIAPRADDDDVWSLRVDSNHHRTG